MLNATQYLSSLEKFDGTNWDDWSCSVRSTCIPTYAYPANSRRDQSTSKASHHSYSYQNRNLCHWGLGLIQLTVKTHIRQSIRENETPAETRLQETYGTQSGLNLGVDINRYFAMSFSPKTPFTQQINEMSELKARIESAGIPIADNLHAMLILRPSHLPTKSLNKKSWRM